MQALYFSKPFRHCVLNYPNINLTQQQQIATPLTHPNSPSLSNTSHSYFPSTSSSTTSLTTMNGNGRTMNGNTATRMNGTANGNGPTTPAAAVEKDQVNMVLAPGMEDTLFSSLKDLFWKISQNKKKTGVIAPINFINKVKKENGNKNKKKEAQYIDMNLVELFRSSMHQDAHEFLNYVLNTIADDVTKYQKKEDENSKSLFKAKGY